MKDFFLCKLGLKMWVYIIHGRALHMAEHYTWQSIIHGKTWYVFINFRLSKVLSFMIHS